MSDFAAERGRSFLDASLAALDDDDDIPEPSSNGHDTTPPDYVQEGPDSLLSASRPQDYSHSVQRLETPPEPDWPEPVDFWGTGHNLAPWQPEYSPSAIAPYIADQADIRGLDATMQAGCCLWTCGLLLQRGIELELHPGSEGMGWREKPLLWVAIRGEPGDGKGPSMDAALYRATKISDRMLAEDLERWKRYEDDDRTHQKALQAWYGERVKNPNAPRPETPEKPPRRRMLADDITKEAVAKLLIENPRGKVGLAKGELASWMGSMGAYGASGAEKDRGDWLEAYESKRRFIDRVKDGGSYDVASWGVPILGGIQPSTLAKIQAKLGDDGMLQRFQIIVSTPKRMVRPRRDDPAATEQWNTVCEGLARMAGIPDNPVRLSHAAQEFFWSCQQWIDNARKGAPVDPLKFALNKWEGLLGRLAIVSHCIHDAAQGHDTPSPEVRLETLEQCWRWMQKILWPHAHYFYTAGIETAMGKNLQKFGDYLLARPAVTEIRTGYFTAQWSHYKTLNTSEIREFWEIAQRHGWVRAQGNTTNRAGTLPAVFVVNPKLRDGRFDERARVSAANVARARETMPAQFRREPGED